MKRQIRRFRHGKWLIQSMKGESLFTAWASIDPSDDPVKAMGDVYYNFGVTEEKAINKVIAEIDRLQDGVVMGTPRPEPAEPGEGYGDTSGVSSFPVIICAVVVLIVLLISCLR